MVTPADAPYTEPELLIVAIDGSTLLQAPNGVELVNPVAAPTHTDVAPPIAAGKDGGMLTPIVAVVKLLPQLLDTV